MAAVAAENTISLVLPGFDAQSLEGKVIGSVYTPSLRLQLFPITLITVPIERL